MTKTQKVVLISVPFLIGAYLIYRQFRKPKPITPEELDDKQKEIEKVKVTPKKIENPTSTCSYPLKKGLYNCSVVGLLQKALNSYPEAVVSRTGSNKVLSALVVDDDFGSKTEDYLEAVTSELAITKGSKVITYTWSTVPTENDFNNLVNEIQKQILIANYRPGVSAPLPEDPSSAWENNPANPNYQLTHPNG